MTIQLKSKFKWFLSEEFKELKGKMFNQVSSDMLKEKYPLTHTKKREVGNKLMIVSKSRVTSPISPKMTL